MSKLPVDLRNFPPNLGAAHARIRAVQPARYERTRNALDGAVTGLSPYITHGLVSLPEVLAGVIAAQGPLPVQHKFVYELGWREYWRHVWQQRGAAIFRSLHPGPLPEAAYAADVPADVREGRTGVPAIDQSIRTLYGTGYLHNHARMWLASYLVHLRKTEWRAGADWLYGHLLDGDLASNTLSWQWVAATASGKPYLFNAENVAKYAPPDWHSPGTVIDTSYASLDVMARSAAVADTAPQALGIAEPALLRGPPDAAAASAARVAGRDVWIVHPWALRNPPIDLPADTLILGLYEQDFYARWPWSATRFSFVDARMRELCEVCWCSTEHDAAAALATARSVRSVRDPHCDLAALPGITLDAAPRLFAAVERPCHSFSQWWRRATQGIELAGDLPGMR